MDLGNERHALNEDGLVAQQTLWFFVQPDCAEAFFAWPPERDGCDCQNV